MFAINGVYLFVSPVSAFITRREGNWTKWKCFFSSVSLSPCFTSVECKSWCRDVLLSKVNEVSSNHLESGLVWRVWLESWDKLKANKATTNDVALSFSLLLSSQKLGFTVTFVWSPHQLTLPFCFYSNQTLLCLPVLWSWVRPIRITVNNWIDESN